MIKILLGLLVGIIAIVYVVVFTSVGNKLLKHTIESKIQEQTKLDSKLEIFSLGISNFEIKLVLNENNTIYLKGNYSLFSQSFDILYKIKLQELKTLKPLTSTQLNGQFRTDGTLKGDMAFLTLDGKSDVASSATTYHIELTEFNPTSIIAKITDAKLHELLAIGGQKKYASAIINLDVNFKDITQHKLDGDVTLKTKNGKLNSFLMLSDFNVTIPKTTFTMNFDVNLKGDEVKYKYDFTSNLFKILSSGKVIPEPLKTDLIYSLNVKELAVLKPIIGADVRGDFKLNGSVKGDTKNMIVDSTSDLASSDTTFTLVLKDLKPSSVVANIKNLKLQKLLYMLNQPHYTDGTFSMNADIKNLDVDNLQGNINTSIENALIDSQYMTNEYNFTSAMPQTTFNIQTSTKLNADIIDSKVNFSSNIASMDVKSVKFNMKDSSLTGDFIAILPDLDKFFFVTNQHMRGAISINGDIKKAKDLDLNIHTKVAGGNIDAKLHNDDLTATLNKVKTLELLDMLMYPTVFKADLDAKVNYNLAHSKGKMDGQLVDGKFTENKLFNLVKDYAKLDLYKENFKGDVSAVIDKENIIASLDLKSLQASIKTKDTKLNTKTLVIDSRVELNINKNEVGATITGDINKPKVKLDVSDVIKHKVKKKFKELLKKFF
jgi:hypothetical protein